ncbi:hypothetical protein BTR23_05970 [Alkalihalophilus pseudofirmus]|nr:hypothetical protein BTR23_05970 [Alkalihalophilus pseudofirmus]
MNGKEHSFHEIEKSNEPKVLKELSESEETSEFRQPLDFSEVSQPIQPTPWKFPSEREIVEPPNLEEIRESDEEEPRINDSSKGWFSNNIIDFNKLKEAKEERSQPFWDDGNRGWSPKLPPVNRKKKGTNRFKSTLAQLPISLIVAGLSAIIVGVGFGFMVLTAFTGEADGNTASLTPANEVVETIATGQAVQAATLPDLSVEIVQGGAFSTSEKGNEIVSAIKARGQAAVLKTGSDPMYMFIGLGLQKEEAGRLSQLYQAQGQDTYVKPFAVNGSIASVDSEAGKQFFTQAGNMFNELVRFSVAGLAGQSVEIGNIETFLNQFQEWNNNGATVLSALPEEVRGQAQQFITSMSGAASELEGYKGEQQEIKLWGIQQHLLEALLSYEALIHVLK